VCEKTPESRNIKSSIINYHQLSSIIHSFVMFFRTNKKINMKNQDAQVGKFGAAATASLKGHGLKLLLRPRRAGLVDLCHGKSVF
jgi:hypothetical protein